jgi:hypothetical protein
MKPTDFHKTATLLKNSREQCDIRTSVNRSYYGLFLFIREFLKNQGVELPSRRLISHHQFVLECLHESRFFADVDDKYSKSTKKNARQKDKTIYSIYARLKSLLQRRTDADYSLQLTFRVTDSEDSLRLATTSVTDFSKLNGSKREQHIIKIANQYAKNIILTRTNKR